uniref:Neur_chan_LBD domain-containing protein n=1 Tax=Heterorhabditis bacteriophora TaxID=37862 RepID=A0A1I7WTX0_HETBA
MSTSLVYVRLVLLWVGVISLDMLVGFRFELLWPFWLIVRAGYEAIHKNHNTVVTLANHNSAKFSVLFVCVTATSDLICYLFIPVKFLVFLASTCIHLELAGGGIPLFNYLYPTSCTQTQGLAPIIPRSLNSFFGAHCIGYPLVIVSFSLRYYFKEWRIRRKQDDVGRKNELLIKLLTEALPAIYEGPKDYSTKTCIEDDCDLVSLELANGGTPPMLMAPPVVANGNGTSHANGGSVKRPSVKQSSSVRQRGSARSKISTVTTVVSHNQQSTPPQKLADDKRREDDEESEGIFIYYNKTCLTIILWYNFLFSGNLLVFDFIKRPTSALHLNWRGCVLRYYSSNLPRQMHEFNCQSVRITKNTVNRKQLNFDQDWNRWKLGQNSHFTIVFSHKLFGYIIIFLFCFFIMFLEFIAIRRYNKLVRPAVNANTTIQIEFKLKLCQLVDVHEKDQVLTTKGWLIHHWFDHRLSWNPSEYGGIRLMHIPGEMIWLPDIILYNNAHGSPSVNAITKAYVQYNGIVTWQPPVIYYSFCNINIEWYPYDIQMCELKFGSWTYSGTQLDLIHLRSDKVRHVLRYNESEWEVERGIDLSEYQESVEWDLLSVLGTRHEKWYPCSIEGPLTSPITFISVEKNSSTPYISLFLAQVSQLLPHGHSTYHVKAIRRYNFAFQC